MATRRGGRLQVDLPGTEPPFPYVSEDLAEGLAMAAMEMAMEPNQLLTQLVRSFLARRAVSPSAPSTPPPGHRSGSGRSG